MSVVCYNRITQIVMVLKPAEVQSGLLKTVKKVSLMMYQCCQQRT